jgi:hypothetical protein
MSQEATAITSISEGFPSERLRSFRLIPRIETYPSVVSLVQTSLGKLALLIVFGMLLYVTDHQSWPVVACLALTTFLPQWRHLTVSIGTLFYTGAILWMQAEHPLRALGMVALVLIGGDLLVWMAARQVTPIGRHALLFLLGGFTSLILICCWVPAHRHHRLSILLWEFALILGTYVWFIGYVLLNHDVKPLHKFGLELGSLRPFWGSTNTPFPNGPACLRQIEARDPEQLAITQLKGLKLLIWSILLSLFLSAYTWFFHEYLGIPAYERALYLSSVHAPLSSLVCWECVILNFFRTLIDISIWGHRIIACCRMAGFEALRNTYRPLSSTTVADFFNRYYFYYKELVVRFFFFPAYHRLPARWGKLRMTLAIFAAVGVGNAYYHFTREMGYLQDHTLWQGLKSFQVFFFYCLVLAAAISISRMRDPRDPSRGFLRGTLIPAFLVSTFYCLLHIFASTDRTYTLVERLHFLGHLFFLS